jgi:protein-S-isoprenylcysteine O-methyltransferase Ste14
MPRVTPAERGPNIRFPPPLVYLGGYAAAWGLQRRLEFDIAGAGAGLVQTGLGLAVVCAGVALAAWGFVTFTRARTAVFPNRPARQFVTWGPYRVTRNPMYVGLALIYAGVALVINWAWPLVLLPVVIVVMRTTIIRREERYMRSAFGETYASYCRHVRRWL